MNQFLFIHVEDCDDLFRSLCEASYFDTCRYHELPDEFAGGWLPLKTEQVFEDDGLPF